MSPTRRVTCRRLDNIQKPTEHVADSTNHVFCGSSSVNSISCASFTHDPVFGFLFFILFFWFFGVLSSLRTSIGAAQDWACDLCIADAAQDWLRSTPFPDHSARNIWMFCSLVTVRLWNTNEDGAMDTGTLYTFPMYHMAEVAHPSLDSLDPSPHPASG